MSGSGKKVQTMGERLALLQQKKPDMFNNAALRGIAGATSDLPRPEPKFAPRCGPPAYSRQQQNHSTFLPPAVAQYRPSSARHPYPPSEVMQRSQCGPPQAARNTRQPQHIPALQQPLSRNLALQSSSCGAQPAAKRVHEEVMYVVTPLKLSESASDTSQVPCKRIREDRNDNDRQMQLAYKKAREEGKAIYEQKQAEKQRRLLQQKTPGKLPFHISNGVSANPPRTTHSTNAILPAGITKPLSSRSVAPSLAPIPSASKPSPPTLPILPPPAPKPPTRSSTAPTNSKLQLSKECELLRHNSMLQSAIASLQYRESIADKISFKEKKEPEDCPLEETEMADSTSYSSPCEGTTNLQLVSCLSSLQLAFGPQCEVQQLRSQLQDMSSQVDNLRSKLHLAQNQKGKEQQNLGDTVKRDSVQLQFHRGETSSHGMTKSDLEQLLRQERERSESLLNKLNDEQRAKEDAQSKVKSQNQEIIQLNVRLNQLSAMCGQLNKERDQLAALCESQKVELTMKTVHIASITRNAGQLVKAELKEQCTSEVKPEFCRMEESPSAPPLMNMLESMQAAAQEAVLASEKQQRTLKWGVDVLQYDLEMCRKELQTKEAELMSLKQNAQTPHPSSNSEVQLQTTVRDLEATVRELHHSLQLERQANKESIQQRDAAVFGESKELTPFQQLDVERLNGALLNYENRFSRFEVQVASLHYECAVLRCELRRVGGESAVQHAEQFLLLACSSGQVVPPGGGSWLGPLGDVSTEETQDKTQLMSTVRTLSAPVAAAPVKMNVEDSNGSSMRSSEERAISRKETPGGQIKIETPLKCEETAWDMQVEEPSPQMVPAAATPVASTGRKRSKGAALLQAEVLMREPVPAKLSKVKVEVVTLSDSE